MDEIPSLPKPTPPEKGIALLPPVCAVEHCLDRQIGPSTEKANHQMPLLYVHLSHFANATVIAISCPHVVADQFGKVNIVKAWVGLIEDETPPPMIDDRI